VEGKKYNWDLAKQDYLLLYKKGPISPEQFFKLTGLPRSRGYQMAKSHSWEATARATLAVESQDVQKVQDEKLLEEAKKEIQLTVPVLGKLRAHIGKNLKKGTVVSKDLKMLSDAMSKCLDMLKLLAREPQHLSAHESFTFIIAPVPAKYAPDEKAVGPLPVGSGAVLREGEVSGDRRGAEDTQDGFFTEVASNQLDKVARGGRGLVPRPNLPAGEDGRVATTAGNDPAQPDSPQVGSRADGGTGGGLSAGAEGMRQP
jgi:hypothetical protein